MATGSKDYWPSIEGFISAQLTSSITNLGTIITSLATTIIRLETGNANTAEIVSKVGDAVIDLSVVNTNTANTVSELTTAVSRLTSMNSKLAAILVTTNATVNQLIAAVNKLAGIETSVETGGDLINKLDNLDGKADGRLDLSVLTNAETGLIAKLFGIDTALKTDSDLINALDMLDNTMDGVLTLSELNISNVVLVLDDVLFTLQLSSLIGYATLSTSCSEIISAAAGRTRAKFVSPSSNSANIYVYEAGSCSTPDLIVNLAPGSVYMHYGHSGQYSAKAVSGSQILWWNEW